jgi:sugar lactone lactonase YvrE
VSAYKPGAKKPYETIGGFSNPTGVAIDSKDDVWVADTAGNRVWMIPAGTKQPKDAGLERIDGPNGIAFGGGDVLYVANFGPYDVTVYRSGSKKPAYTITDGITGPTLNGVTAADIFFQSNQENDVVGYKNGTNKPFSTIVGNGDPLGIASSPEVKK